jgi:hypothetical protein
MTHFTQKDKIMLNFKMPRILENANGLIESIARLMLRPLGSNIEFGEPTVRCKPILSVGNAGTHLV